MYLCETRGCKIEVSGQTYYVTQVEGLDPPSSTPLRGRRGRHHQRAALRDVLGDGR